MVEVLLHATMATGGFVLGVLAGRAAARRRRPAAPLPAICPCRHPISYHADGVGRCNGSLGFSRARYDAQGIQRGYEHPPCPCLNYAGPEPISSITMRPVAYRPAMESPPDEPPK